MGGETPAVPVPVAELERLARETMEERAANYVFAGAGGEHTIGANREALDRRRIVPSMLRDVSERDLSTSLLGTALPAPLLLAPIGVQKAVHEEGELGTARAAAALGLPMIASTASHFTMEEIAEAGGADAPRWFQLYWPNDPELLESFVGRAEAGGVRGDRGHGRHLHPRLEAARPAAGLAPLPRRERQRQLLPGPGLPRRPRAAARGGPGRRDRPLPGSPLQSGPDLGRPGAAARPDLAADPRQGDPARRRRPRGGRARHRRNRRLQPRRAAVGRGAGLAGRAAADRRGCRRPS